MELTEIQIGVLPEKYDGERNGKSMHIYIRICIYKGMDSSVGSWNLSWVKRGKSGTIDREIG